MLMLPYELMQLCLLVKEAALVCLLGSCFLFGKGCRVCFLWRLPHTACSVLFDWLCFFPVRFFFLESS